MPVTLDPTAALLVVDVQSGTLVNAQAIPADTLVENARQLVDAFHHADRPVIFAVSAGTPPVRTAANSGGRTFPDEFSVLDSRLGRVDADLVLVRKAWSAFSGTDLERHLRTRGVGELVVVGLATTYGIESTVRYAADSQLNVVVPVDAISEPVLEHHEAALAQRFPLLARLTATAEVLAALQ